MYIPTEREEFLCKEIVDCAYRVHKELGPGLLEKIYEICFCHELSKKGIKYRRQVDLPVFYDGLFFEEGLRLDVCRRNYYLRIESCRCRKSDLASSNHKSPQNAKKEYRFSNKL